jgi:hypothetical protein
MKNRSPFLDRVAIAMLLGALLLVGFQYRQLQRQNKELARRAAEASWREDQLIIDLANSRDYPFVRVRQVEQENARLRATIARIKALGLPNLSVSEDGAVAYDGMRAPEDRKPNP